MGTAMFAVVGTSIPDVKDSAPEVWWLLMALNMIVGTRASPTWPARL
jgi:hypothetical protein